MARQDELGYVRVQHARAAVVEAQGRLRRLTANQLYSPTTTTPGV